MLLFLFATDHRHIFCSSWIRGISENSRKQICIACSKSVFYKFFSRTEGGWYWKVKERDTVNSTANLSTIRYLTNRSMIQVHHITEVSDLSPCSATLSPSLRPPLDSLRSPIFFLFVPVPLIFPLMLSITERSIDNAAIHFSLSRPRSMDTRETERTSFFFFFWT